MADCREPSSARRWTKTKGPATGLPELVPAAGAWRCSPANRAARQSSRAATAAVKLARGGAPAAGGAPARRPAEILRRSELSTRRRTLSGASSLGGALGPGDGARRRQGEADNGRRRSAGREAVGRAAILPSLKSKFLGWRPIYCALAKSLEWVALLGIFGSIVGDDI
jgi:hypothetical protein